MVTDFVCPIPSALDVDARTQLGKNPKITYWAPYHQIKKYFRLPNLLDIKKSTEINIILSIIYEAPT